MKRKTSNLQTKIYSYGLLQEFNDTHVEEQFYKYHEYQKDLTALKNRKLSDIYTLLENDYKTNKDIIKYRLAEAKEQEIREQIKKANKDDRKKGENQLLKDELKTTQELKKSIRDKYFLAMKKIKKKHSKKINKILHDSTEEKIARAKVSKNNLYSGSYLLVEKAIESALKAHLKQHGFSSQLKIKPFRNDDRIGCQFYRSGPNKKLKIDATVNDVLLCNNQFLHVIPNVTNKWFLNLIQESDKNKIHSYKQDITDLESKILHFNLLNKLSKNDKNNLKQLEKQLTLIRTEYLNFVWFLFDDNLSKSKNFAKRHSYVDVKIRVGTDKIKKPIWANYKCMWHRMPPRTAGVKWAWVKRFNVGSIIKSKLQITIESEDFNENKLKINDGFVSLDIGVRKLKNGDIRVGTCCTSNGEYLNINMPFSLVQKIDYAFSIQSISDKIFDEVKNIIKEKREVLKGLPDSFMEFTKTIKQKKSHKNLAKTVFGLTKFILLPDETTLMWNKWKTSKEFHKDFSYNMINKWLIDNFDLTELQCFSMFLEIWRRKNKHLFENERNIVRSAIASRDNLYKIWANKLVTKYGIVLLEKNLEGKALNIDKWRKNTEPEESNTNYIGKGIMYAAPGKLREYIVENGFSKLVDSKNTSKMCHKCGYINKIDSSVEITCEKCNIKYDRDYNSSINICNKYIEEIKKGTKITEAKFTDVCENEIKNIHNKKIHKRCERSDDVKNTEGARSSVIHA